MPDDAVPPFVSVLLPVRNERAAIESCLKDVLAQDYPPDRMQVVVADGRSDDGTRGILDQFAAREPRLQVIDNPGMIVSTGLNAAIAKARGSVLLRMDAHSTYAADYVTQCVGTLRGTGADNVGGPARVRAGHGGLLASAVAAAYASPFSVGGALFHDVNYEGPVDTITYGCWPRKTFETFGLFDETLARNQDDEHNLRIVRGGGTVYQSPSIRSWYRTRSSLVDLFRQYAQYGYWKVRVIQKHRLPASPRHLVPVVFLVGVVLGAILAVSVPILRPLYGLGLLSYLTLSTVFSVAAARRSGWSLLSLLPVVFFVYHVAYGWGFLRGLLDFVVFKRGAAPEMTALSRGRRAQPEP